MTAPAHPIPVRKGMVIVTLASCNGTATRASRTSFLKVTGSLTWISSHVVVLPEGRSRGMEPTDVVATRILCLLLDEASEEVRGVEPNRHEPAPDGR